MNVDSEVMVKVQDELIKILLDSNLTAVEIRVDIKKGPSITLEWEDPERSDESGEYVDNAIRHLMLCEIAPE